MSHHHQNEDKSWMVVNAADQDEEDSNFQLENARIREADCISRKVDQDIDPDIDNELDNCSIQEDAADLDTACRIPFADLADAPSPTSSDAASMTFVMADTFSVTSLDPQQQHPPSSSSSSSDIANTATAATTTADCSTSTDQATNMVHHSTSTDDPLSSSTTTTTTTSTVPPPLTVSIATCTERLLPQASQTEMPNTNAIETQTSSSSTSTSTSTATTTPSPQQQQQQVEVSKLTARITVLEKEISLLQTYKQAQTDTLIDYQQQIATLTTENSRLSDLVKLFNTDLNSRVQEITQLQQDIQTLKTADAHRDTLQLAVQNAAKTRMELEENTNTLLAKIDDLTSANSRAHQHCQIYASTLLRLVHNGITPSCEPEAEVRKHLENVITSADLPALLVSDDSCVTTILKPWADAVISAHNHNLQLQQREREQQQEKEKERQQQQQQQQQQEALNPAGLILATSNFKARDNALFIADPTGTFYEAFNVGAPNHIVSSETLANCSLNPKKLSRFIGTIVAIEPQTAAPRNPFKLQANTPIFMCDVMLFS